MRRFLRGPGRGRRGLRGGLRTGLRLGELRALRWQDVDLVVGRIRVVQSAWEETIGTTKTDRAREVPLGDDVLEALKTHRHLRGPFVFCQSTGKYAGELLPRDRCNWPLWRACKRAGLRHVGWHVLRHSFASNLVILGASLKVVQELLGHTSITMTMRYAHLSKNVARDAVRLLDRATTWHQCGTNGGAAPQPTGTA